MACTYSSFSCSEGRRAVDVATSCAMNALAPLLSASPRGLTARQRPLAGSWMMVCVVLVAAYQGKLLSKLTKADPVEEINSFQDLVESNLSVLEWDALFTASLPPELLPRVVYAHVPLERELEMIAENRNVSRLYNANIRRGLTAYLVPEKRLHVVSVPTQLCHSMFMTAKSSPYEKPLRRIIGRVYASGIMDHWQAFAGLRIARPRWHSRELALGWRHVQALFVVWAAGLAVALAVFAAEGVVR